MSEELEKSIESVRRIIETGIDEVVTNNPNANFITCEIEPEQFVKTGRKLKSTLDETTFDYKISTEGTGEITEEDSKKIESFNNGLDDRSREFVICSAFQAVINDILSELLEINEDDESSRSKLYNKLAAVLDLEVHIILEVYSLTKHIYFDSLSQILKFLFSISTSEVDHFWTYLESRERLIKDKIFDKQIIGDRIAVLEICNSLTDKFNSKTSSGKKIPYTKDTFNDRFQFRVRTFVTSLFSFEDNTGLNKYFNIANREPPNITSQQRGRDKLVDDLVAIQKLFNDPFHYLQKRNLPDLQRMCDKMTNIFKFIRDQDQRVVPDQFLVSNPKPEAEVQYLKKKYSDLLYIPENFPLSQFDTFKDRKEHAKLQNEDRAFFEEQLLSPKVKFQYLFQIYIIASIFFELAWENKEALLNELKAPTNIKHLTDETLSESCRANLLMLRRDVFAYIKSLSDSQFAYLLQNIMLSEKIWWGWLIYGKDPKTNEPYFLNKLLTQEELAIAQDKFMNVFPFKPNKYFNTYVTPQLTRRMRTQIGIAKLHNPPEFSSELAHAKIEQITDSIEECADDLMKSQFIEERTILLWKRLRKERTRKWLEFGGSLKPDIFQKDDFNKTKESNQRKRGIEETDGGDSSKRIKV